MREKVLEEAGWTLTCESPLEIEHEDGSTATLQGAQIVIDYLIAEDNLSEAPNESGDEPVVLDEDDIEIIEKLINGNGGDEFDAVEEFLKSRIRDYFDMDQWDEPEEYDLIFDYKGRHYHMEIEEGCCIEATGDHRIMEWTGTVTKV